MKDDDEVMRLRGDARVLTDRAIDPESTRGRRRTQ
jgi:hypothetical protein